MPQTQAEDNQDAQNEARNEASGVKPQGENLNELVGRLKAENEALLADREAREAGSLPAGPPRLPDPRTVSDAEYIQNADAFRKQYGIRRQTFGGWK